MGSVDMTGNDMAGVLIHHFVGIIVGVMTAGMATAFSVWRVSSSGIAILTGRRNSEKMMMMELERRNTFLLVMTLNGLMRCFTRRFYSEKYHSPTDSGRVYCREGIKVQNVKYPHRFACPYSPSFDRLSLMSAGVAGLRYHSTLPHPDCCMMTNPAIKRKMSQ